MDTGSGNIFNEDEIKLEDIKGDLVRWKVGEEVFCKGCKFTVQEISTFPFNTVLLKGKPR